MCLASCSFPIYPNVLDAQGGGSGITAKIKIYSFQYQTLSHSKWPVRLLTELLFFLHVKLVVFVLWSLNYP